MMLQNVCFAGQPAFWVGLVVSVLFACQGSGSGKGNDRSDADGATDLSELDGSVDVPTPQMPSHWQVESDFLVPPAQVRQMSSRLGGRMAGVRNTVFIVQGNRVQVNTIIAVDGTQADLIMAALRDIKAEEALLQQGTTIYEFVGPNEVLPFIAEGRQHLAQ